MMVEVGEATGFCTTHSRAAAVGVATWVMLPDVQGDGMSSVRPHRYFQAAVVEMACYGVVRGAGTSFDTTLHRIGSITTWMVSHRKHLNTELKQSSGDQGAKRFSSQ